MRWEQLFADLENSFQAQQREDLVQEIRDVEQAEAATITLADRLRGACGQEVQITLLNGAIIEGTVGIVGADWVALGRQNTKIFIWNHAIAAAVGLGRSGTIGSEVERRRPWTAMIRMIANDSLRQRIIGPTGSYQGEIQAVSADHLVVIAAGKTLFIPIKNLWVVHALG